MNELTTCAGQDCERLHECLRCIDTEEHDTQQLCYSGFTFFKIRVEHEYE